MDSYLCNLCAHCTWPSIKRKNGDAAKSIIAFILLHLSGIERPDDEHRLYSLLSRLAAGKSWPGGAKKDRSFFCLFCPHMMAQTGQSRQAGRATKRHFLLATLPLPSRQRSILLHRLLPIHPNQTRLWRSVQTCFIHWGKKRQPPKVQLKNWPNFAQSFLSSRHYNINKAPRQKLIYQVIIWPFLLLSLSFLCRRMISETMLDLAAYLRRFYSS